MYTIIIVIGAIILGVGLMSFAWNGYLEVLGLFILAGGLGWGAWYIGGEFVAQGERHNEEKRQLVEDIRGQEEDRGEQEEEDVLRLVKEKLGAMGDGSIKSRGNGMYGVVFGATLYEVWVNGDGDIEYIIEGIDVLYDEGVKYTGKIEDSVGRNE